MPQYKPLIPREIWEIEALLDKLVQEGKMIKEPSDTTISGWRYTVVKRGMRADANLD